MKLRLLIDSTSIHDHSMSYILLFSGEGLMFGIEEGKIREYLGERGFQNIHDANNNELEGLYFKGKNLGRKVAYGYSIASAETMNTTSAHEHTPDARMICHPGSSWRSST